MSLNRVVLVGRIAQDIIARKSQAGTTFVNFTIAVNRNYTKQGEEQQTDFINCVVFGKPAEYMEMYLKKGYLIGVEGRIQTRNYENQQGQKVYVTEVICDSVQNLTPKQSTEQHQEYKNGDTFKRSEVETPFSIDESDLPF